MKLIKRFLWENSCLSLTCLWVLASWICLIEKQYIGFIGFLCAAYSAIISYKWEMLSKDWKKLYKASDECLTRIMKDLPNLSWEDVE